jgi:uncharacterized membrane protein
MLGPVTWYYLNEICHKNLLFIPFFAKWVLNLLTALFYPSLLHFYGGPAIFQGHAIFTIVNAAMAWLLFKETKGLNKKELEQLYR